MRRSVAFLLGALALLSTGTVGSCLIASRIVGGEKAGPNEYPYQASLRIRGDHKCGGSLLNERWILTSAHCLVKYELSSFIVVLGSNSLIFGGVAFRAEVAHLHPDYARGEHHDDIALIKLGEDAVFTEAIAPVQLPDEDVDEDNRITVYTGWGSSDKAGAKSFNLKAINLTTISLSACRKVFPSVTVRDICTLNGADEGLCYGDAGSALVSDGRQIGIGSWGSPCARGYPDVHTRVFSYIGWIRAIIDD